MNDSGLVDHCLELLSPLGATSMKRMFSGNALYIDGLCVALIIRDTLYLKVDDASRAQFEAAHCRPFTYETKKGERSALSYYTAPEGAMESPHEMIPWARRALAAAVSARAKAPPKKKNAATTAKASTKTAAKAAPKAATKTPAARKATTKPASKPDARPAAKKAAPAKRAAKAATTTPKATPTTPKKARPAAKTAAGARRRSSAA